jgi:microcystin degradation protein MlrC
MDLAKREVNALAQEAWNRRHEFVPELLTPAEAVEKAIQFSKNGYPIVLPDMSDNPGGGGTSDSVAILEEFIKRGVEGVAVATICDPEVAEMAHRAGVGATIAANLGGKVDHLHGPGIPIEGKVRSLSDGRYTLKGSMMTGIKFSLGRTAVLEVAGNLVIVGTERQQALDPEIMRSQGLDPGDFRFLVLKSAVHFRSNFTELAHDIVEVTGPGVHSSRLSDFEYHKIRRPLFPLDSDFSWAAFNP